MTESPPDRDSSAPGLRAPRFNSDRPANIRRATPGHPYAHHIRTLPARLEALAGHLHVPRGGRVLDYGCADVPYRHFFGGGTDYLPADLPGNPHALLDLNADGSVPADDESFDAVLSTQVLEHVTDPRLYLSECFRVLRPGGRLLLSTHGIFVYHPDPVDLWRWTSAGLEHEVERAGFVVEQAEGIIGLAATGLQLVQDALYWRLPTWLQPRFARAMQAAVSFADRREEDWLRNLNAQVFALVAVRPERPGA